MNQISRKNLLEALVLYKNAFESDIVIHLDIKDNKCILQASDRIISLDINFPVDTQDDKAETLTINSDQLVNFLKNSDVENLDLDFKKNHILLLGKSKLQLPVLADRIVRYAQVSNDIPKTVIDHALFLSQVSKRILPFIIGSHHNTLNSACVKSNEDGFEIYGTDGYRIAKLDFKGKDYLKEVGNLDCIIPQNVLTLLGKLNKSNDLCYISADDNLIAFETSYNHQKTSRLKLTACLSKVSYPNISTLINYEPKYQWEINIEQLLQYCDMHKIIGDGSGEITLTKDTLYLKNTSSDNTTSMDSTIDNIKLIKGSLEENESRKIRLSLKFLSEAIAVTEFVADETLIFGLDDTKNLVWLKDNKWQDQFRATAIIAPIE